MLSCVRSACMHATIHFNDWFARCWWDHVIRDVYHASEPHGLSACMDLSEGSGRETIGVLDLLCLNCFSLRALPASVLPSVITGLAEWALRDNRHASTCLSGAGPNASSDDAPQDVCTHVLPFLHKAPEQSACRLKVNSPIDAFSEVASCQPEPSSICGQLQKMLCKKAKISRMI